MNKASRQSCWNRVAVFFQVIGVIVTWVVTDTLSLGGLTPLFFMVPIYAVFCFLAAASAGLALVRGEPWSLLSGIILIGSFIMFCVLLGLTLDHWHQGIEFWGKALKGRGH